MSSAQTIVHINPQTRPSNIYDRRNDGNIFAYNGDAHSGYNGAKNSENGNNDGDNSL